MKISIDTPELDKERAARETGHSQLLGAWINWAQAVDNIREHGIFTIDYRVEYSRNDIVTGIEDAYASIVSCMPDMTEASQEQLSNFTEWFDELEKHEQGRSIQRILYDYFDIDMNKAEKERVAILEQQRELNAAQSPRDPRNM